MVEKECQTISSLNTEYSGTQQELQSYDQTDTQLTASVNTTKAELRAYSDTI